MTGETAAGQEPTIVSVVRADWLETINGNAILMARSRSKRNQTVQRGQSKKPAAQRSRRSREPAKTLFQRQNYMLLLLGVLAIVIGYTTMRIENEVDGIISLYIAPLLILGGYLEIIYAILWRPKAATEDASQ